MCCPDAAAQGVQPDQIIFTDVAMKSEHIKRSALADLFLDSYVASSLVIYVLEEGYFVILVIISKFDQRLFSSSCTGLFVMHTLQVLMFFGLVCQW